jgi:histidinol-phosphatase (PHP family)
VLTDHHTHLAPDGDPLDEEAVSLERIVAHTAAAMDRGLAAVAITEHVYRFRAAAPAWDHPYWREQAQWDIDAYWEALAEAQEAGFPLRIGIECDYLGEGQEEIDAALAGRPWDLLLGSVHWIADGALDHPDFLAFDRVEPDDLWRSYGERYAQAALSGRFDVMTHADLPKSFGPLPTAAVRDEVFDTIAAALEQADVCVEISTAGLRKAAQELYPGPDLLTRCYQRGVPIVFSSDAHEPADVGRDFDLAVRAAVDTGYSEVMEIKGRDRRAVPLV